MTGSKPQKENKSGDEWEEDSSGAESPASPPITTPSPKKHRRAKKYKELSMDQKLNMLLTNMADKKSMGKLVKKVDGVQTQLKEVDRAVNTRLKNLEKKTEADL